jgi:predicted TIM-barrel fold metal-dependent hydrolase
MHQSDTALSDYLELWEGYGVDRNAFEPSPFRVVAMGKRDIEDALAAMICHGALTRFPELRVASIENGAYWVPHLLHALDTAYRQMPQEFEEHPVEVFKRNIYISPFWEDDPNALIDIMGPDHVLFGSDFPHPEGLADPLSYAEKLAGQPHDTLRKVMSDNIRGLLGLPAALQAA